MNAPRVLVLGGANVDVKVTAVGPTAQGISTPGQVRVVPGGVARNVAEALARLGAAVRLVTVVGNDPWGEWLIAQTAAAGVDVGMVIRHAGQTGFYVTMDGHGVADAAIVEAAAAEVWLRTPIGDADLVVLDANLAEAALGELAARALIRFHRGTRERATLARAVQAWGPEWVLLTEGRRGLALLGKGWTAAPAHPGAVVNTTGAGDTAAALVMVGLLRGWSAAAVLPLAAKAATMTLEIWGNVHPDVGILLMEGRAS